MDQTETYIQMCAKAEKIQNLRPLNKEWEEGDYYHHHGDWNKCYFERIASSDNDWHTTGTRNEYETWLPRQDQLQEMLFLHDSKGGLRQSWWLVIIRLFEVISPLYKNTKDMSMEQLWLAFVMKEKYGKVWDGTEWKTEPTKREG